MKIKMLAFIILAAVLLSACTANNSSTETTNESTTETTAETEPLPSETSAVKDAIFTGKALSAQDMDSTLYSLISKIGTSLTCSFSEGDTVSVDDLMILFAAYELYDEQYEKYIGSDDVVYSIPKQTLIDEFFAKHFALNIDTNNSEFDDPKNTENFNVCKTLRDNYVGVIDYGMEGNICTAHCVYGYAKFKEEDFTYNGGDGIADVYISSYFDVVMEYEDAENYKYLDYHVYKAVPVTDSGVNVTKQEAENIIKRKIGDNVEAKYVEALHITTINGEKYFYVQAYSLGDEISDYHVSYGKPNRNRITYGWYYVNISTGEAYEENFGQTETDFPLIEE